MGNQNEQNDNAVRFVILTQDILADKNINAIEKIVLARICGFDEFFESSEKTASTLNTTTLVVQRAKRKLEKLGFIKVVTDTGRGKVYAPVHEKIWKSPSRYDKKVTPDMTKKSHQTGQKCHTENKDRIKEEIKGDESPAKASKDLEKDPDEYGNPKINEFAKKWASATGNDCSKIKRERRAIYNLIKSQSEEGIEAILSAVQKIHESSDRYAPSITTPSELVGQYSKLPKLRLYVAKHESVKSKSRKTLEKKYGSGMPDYSVSDEERKKVNQAIKTMKKSGNLPWVRVKEVESENDK